MTPSSLCRCLCLPSNGQGHPTPTPPRPHHTHRQAYHIPYLISPSARSAGRLLYSCCRFASLGVITSVGLKLSILLLTSSDYILLVSFFASLSAVVLCVCVCPCISIHPYTSPTTVQPWRVPQASHHRRAWVPILAAGRCSRRRRPAPPATSPTAAAPPPAPRR